MSRKKRTEHSRGVEHLIYAFMWILVIAFPLLNELIQAERGLSFSWTRVALWWIRTIPFLILFLLHNSLLIPNFLLHGKIKRYFFSVLLIVSIFAVYESARYHTRFDTALIEKPQPPQPPQFNSFIEPPHPHQFTPPAFSRFHGSIPMPLMVNILLGMLMLGCNLAIALLFKYHRDQENQKYLDSMRLQEEIRYLKAQINPHFFMNMLNNIHAMVEIDQGKAQEMIIELSKLMRYVLYEGENAMTTLANEVRFITCYVELMRKRYHPDKVDVELIVPEHPDESMKLPPLLFIAFIENAFKHGISYRRKTYIHISLKEEDNFIHFQCRNTKPDIVQSDTRTGGVGLENVRRRIDLLYKGESTLEINDESDHYSVNLIIPSK